ncbi:hypothetical protein WJ438_29740 [Streptomyces sp. GD-15H]|uniref:hypothetical protein n=1 Tax=Streptomyces sp. GD-15H TaxID=3129112 RepID=UPI0032471490
MELTQATVNGLLARLGPEGGYLYLPSDLDPQELTDLWAFGYQNRARVGVSLAEVLTTEAVPKLQRLLDREKLLLAIKSPERPSIRRWGAVQSELVLMADVNPRERVEQLLSLLDRGDTFAENFDRWIALRREHAA